jgi:HEAT repeat protein
MKSFFKEVADRIIGDTNPSEITNSAAEALNSYEIENIFPPLQNILGTSNDIFERSRAFDGIMKLEKLDTVEFLLGLFESSKQQWGQACINRLAQFQDQRSIEKLCEILQTEDNADLRYIAAEGLEPGLKSFEL